MTKNLYAIINLVGRCHGQWYAGKRCAPVKDSPLPGAGLMFNFKNIKIMKKLIKLSLFVFLAVAFAGGSAYNSLAWSIGCPNGSGSIDNDPNTPYCMATTANYCCIEEEL